MEQMTKMLKIFLLILLLSSVCYCIYPKKKILDNLDHRNKNTPTSSSKMTESRHHEPSTSGVQNSFSIPEKKYERNVGENGKVKYVCNGCSYQSSALSTASHHWYDKHGSRIFKCAECEYESSRKSTFKRHQQTVHEELKQFTCDQCDYTGRDKHTLTQHINARHLKLKEYKCTQCKYETAWVRDLKRHLKNIHSDPK